MHDLGDDSDGLFIGQCVQDLLEAGMQPRLHNPGGRCPMHWTVRCLDDITLETGNVIHFQYLYITLPYTFLSMSPLVRSHFTNLGTWPR